MSKELSHEDFMRISKNSVSTEAVDKMNFYNNLIKATGGAYHKEYETDQQENPDSNSSRPPKAKKTTNETPSGFKLSDASGVKSDLLQVFYALHKLHLIEKSTGGFPNQNEFLEAFGRFLGEDWSERKTSPLISQRKNDKTLEKQDEFFDKLKDKWHRK